MRLFGTRVACNWSVMVFPIAAGVALALVPNMSVPVDGHRIHEFKPSLVSSKATPDDSPAASLQTARNAIVLEDHLASKLGDSFQGFSLAEKAFLVSVILSGAVRLYQWHFSKAS